jgi:RNA exonuclease 4
MAPTSDKSSGTATVQGTKAWGHRTNQAFHHQESHLENSSHGHYSANAGFQMPHPSSIVALDCEMVGTGKYGERSSVARVTLIDWGGKVLVDTYVIQKQKVTDYRTFVSGITKEDLDGADMTLEQCRELVSRILYNRILVGHGLKNDMVSLGINHPWWLTRDTATHLPFMKKRANNLAWWPRKLKELASEKLEREIQVFGKPHSPFEDALAALDIYKTVQSDWETKIYGSLIKTNKFQEQQIAEHRMALMQRQNQVYTNNYHYNNNQRRQRYYVPRQELVQ